MKIRVSLKNYKSFQQKCKAHKSGKKPGFFCRFSGKMYKMLGATFFALKWNVKTADITTYIEYEK
jgi:hypothetical protein